MTRTERNQNPAALLRDRHSRSGLLKNTEQLRKNGAGAHNWGSFRQEGEHEQEAGADALFDMEDTENRDPASRPPSLVQDAEVGSENKEVLGDPATSPSESMSSLDSGEAQVNGNGGGNKVGMGPRRMSNVSEEERERARVYREGVMNKGGVDLAHIARTSYGIATSPPNGNAFSTSPVKTKGSLMQK